MIGDRQRLSDWVGLGHTVGPTLVLLWLLHRAMGRTDAHPDALFLYALGDVGKLPWGWPYLAAVVIVCGLGVLRRSRATLVRVQWVALGCGLFLTLYGLGAEVGEKVDPRGVFAMLGGIASLYACYACLLAHGLLWLLSRPRSLDGGRKTDRSGRSGCDI